MGKNLSAEEVDKNIDKILGDLKNNDGQLISKEYWGLYNMVCRGVTSRFEVALSLIHI